MQRLLSGYRRFRAERWPKERALYRALAAGQTPRLLVIACSDSRVDPATIFAAEPGELFIIRNVANVVPPFVNDGGLHAASAAIEFAVKKLKVRTILVMGHAACGGVSAALSEDRDADSPFLAAWIDLIAPAKARCAACSDGDLQTALERENVKLSLERLLTFPFVAEAASDGRLALEGARFGIQDGKLEIYDAIEGVFQSLD
ncbi:MAG: carbonic anhydrase [Alphaproteobacteria bacterium]|jgi:carbonic anhydrase|nr:carbonic anhydrase [Alphaproteobacteria bacterium]